MCNSDHSKDFACNKYGGFIRSVIIPSINTLTPLKAFRYRELKLQEDWIEREIFDRIRIKRLQKILRVAWEEVPFYRRKFQEAGMTPHDIRDFNDLKHFPVTTRAELDLHFPFETIKPSKSWNFLRCSSSSGTAHAPFRIVQDIESVNHKYAAKMRCFSIWGCDPGDPFVRWMPEQPVFQMKSLFKGTVFFEYLEKALVYPIIHRRTVISGQPRRIDGNLEIILESVYKKLTQRKVNLLECYSHYAWILARYMNERDLKLPNILAVNLTGGITTSLMRHEIDIAFPINFRDYGAREMGLMACECGSREGMHICEGDYHIESVVGGKTAPPGVTGRLLVTDLRNAIMPIIRVENGDSGRMIEGACSCGRNSRLMECDGRTKNMIVGENGDHVLEGDVRDAAISVKGIEFFEIRQTAPSELVVSIIKKHSAEIDEKELISKMHSLFGDGWTVNIQYPDFIRSKKYSRKFRCVIAGRY